MASIEAGAFIVQLGAASCSVNWEQPQIIRAAIAINRLIFILIKFVMSKDTTLFEITKSFPIENDFVIR